MSSGKSSQKRYIVMASWDKSGLFGPPPTALPNSDSPSANNRPVNIHYYIKATFTGYELPASSLILAHVSWFYPHPNRCAIGNPAQLWCSNMFESFGMHSFLPLDHLMCRCAHGIQPFEEDESLLVIVPLVE